MRWSAWNLLRVLGHYALVRSTTFIVLLSVAFLTLNEYGLRIYYNAPPVAPYALYWLIMAFTFSTLVLVPWRPFILDRERLMVQAFMTGLLLGFFIAGVKVVLYRDLWTVFNLLAEPLRTALFALVVVWVVAQRLAAPGAASSPVPPPQSL